MGQTLPAYKEDEDEMMMPPDMEVKVSQMAAMASQQLLAQHSQEAQQAKAQQQAQDPLIQLQQQELALKGQDLQRKAQKDMSDAQLKQEQIMTERLRIAAQQQMEVEKLDRQHTSEGFRTAADLHKHEQQLANQRRQQDMQAQQRNQQKSQPKKKGD